MGAWQDTYGYAKPGAGSGAESPDSGKNERLPGAGDIRLKPSKKPQPLGKGQLRRRRLARKVQVMGQPLPLAVGEDRLVG